MNWLPKFLFQSPRERLADVAREIVDGLRDGSIVPDPPLAIDEGEALPTGASKETTE